MSQGGGSGLLPASEICIPRLRRPFVTVYVQILKRVNKPMGWLPYPNRVFSWIAGQDQSLQPAAKATLSANGRHSFVALTDSERFWKNRIDCDEDFAPLRREKEILQPRLIQV